MIQRTFYAGLLACSLLCTTAIADELDLSRAAVVLPFPEKLSLPDNKKPARMLVEEVEKRTHLRWPVVGLIQDPPEAYIFLGTPESLKGVPSGGDRVGLDEVARLPDEGFRIQVFNEGATTVIYCVGKDARGLLFAVGRLLREMKLTNGKAVIDDNFKITTAPEIPLRGHQLGYRPKTNSYDAWTVELWEQYIRDLVVFGNNAIELIPPRSDDDDQSPHFPLPKIEMMIEMSRICDEYDQDVWIWYPAMDEDYGDPKTVEFAIKEWGEVFKKLPRIDVIFVPGGDPGHTHPEHLMALLEKQTENLRLYHPEAEMWVSPQSFSDEWHDIFLDIVNKQKPDWLGGIVFGPQVWTPLPKLREQIDKKYPIRRYPDITHSRHCQYPVPDWDLAYALTIAREGINPRPTDHVNIFRRYQKYSDGFITYSEGCNDDVNKIVWSMLGWDPNTPVMEILRQYSRYFIGPEYEEEFANGLLALERNWRGPLLTNQGVYTTLQQFQTMEANASPKLLLNWRFQQALYRAYYDAYVRSRLIYETALEDQALQQLRAAVQIGSLQAIDKAEKVLDRVVTDPPSPQWRARVFELGDALFKSIRMQLSVQRHKAIAVERGANLDTIDTPLNNRNWLKKRFAAIRELDDEQQRLAEIDKIVNWTNPGPGGFYDDLGDPARQPHLVRGRGAKLDPQYFESSLLATNVRWGKIPDKPFSWWRHAGAMKDAPLTMQYNDLDPKAKYRLRVCYSGDMPPIKIRLTADEVYEIHPLIDKSMPEPLFEFNIPPEATADGELTLQWFREPGIGRNGRGCQVAEVWLIKK